MFGKCDEIAWNLVKIIELGIVAEKNLEAEALILLLFQNFPYFTYLDIYWPSIFYRSSLLNLPYCIKICQILCTSLNPQTLV